MTQAPLFDRRLPLPILNGEIDVTIQRGRYVPAGTDPFRFIGPTLVSFSGGRTSAYMLRRILEAHEDRLPAEVHVAFFNTGRERPETLDFVHDVETRWDVPVTWLEYDRKRDGDGWRHTYRVVDYRTADRTGKPFAALIRSRSYLPNKVARFCTQELKVRIGKKWMLAQGYQHWTAVVGIRADEPKRLGRTDVAERWERIHPLADAGVTLAEVMGYWKQSRGGADLTDWLAMAPESRPGWDLALTPDEGNCDLCFLKGTRKLERLIADRPDLADWWIRQEDAVSKGALGVTAVARFNTRHTYENLLARATGKGPLIELMEEAVEDCHCTD